MSYKRWTIVALIATLILGAIYFVSRPQVAPSPGIVVESFVHERTEASPPAIAAVPSQESPALSADPEASPVLRSWSADYGQLFSGRVSDLHGNPVSTASVILLPSRMSFSTDHNGIYKASIPANMRIAADGELTLAPRVGPQTYDLIATHADYSDSDRITVSSDVKQVNFTLKPLGTIEGRVVSARNGQPVIDFRIRPELRHDRVPTTLEADFKRIREPAGRFRLERIKAGTATICVVAKGFADTTITFPPILAGETRDRVEVRLQPGAVLRGQVVDQEGRGVRLARVSGGNPPRGDVADSNGNFELDSLPVGPFDLLVKHERFAPKTVVIMLSNAAINFTRIVVNSGTTLEGEITQGGAPMPGKVTVRAKNVAALQGVAGQDGRYQVHGVPDGLIQVTGVIEKFGSSWSKTIETEMVGGNASYMNFDFPAATASVFGTLLTLPGSRLYTGTLVASFDDFTLYGPTRTTISRRTSPDGSYTLELPSGDIVIQFHKPTGTSIPGPSEKTYLVTLQDDENRHMDIKLYGGAILRIDLDGAEIPQWATVLVAAGEYTVDKLDSAFMRSLNIVGQYPLDDKGQCTIGDLDPGTYTVLAMAPPTPQAKAAGAISLLLATTTITVSGVEEITVPLAMRDN